MKKIDFKGSLLTVCYYAVLFFGAFIIYKLREKTAITFSTKYSSLIILVICLLFILFGILVFYFADRKNVSRKPMPPSCSVNGSLARMTASTSILYL